MSADPPVAAPPRAAWLPWLFGAALIAVVVAIPLRLSEWNDFLALFQSARPRWLAAALVLQAITYFAQAEVFGVVPRSIGIPLTRRWLCRLSLAKLFLDQALPSAGISSAVIATAALRRQGVPRRATSAAVILNIASYHAAYVLALLAAIGILLADGYARPSLLGVAVLFLAFASALTIVVLAAAGGRLRERAAPLKRLRFLRAILEFVEDADPALVRRPRLLLKATAWQLAIVLADAATMWTLVRALGQSAGPSGIYASFMISSLFRTVGIAPGGLGTYEATSIVTLRMIGLSLPVALSTTMLFRGLSFWIPMLPGLWFSRAFAHEPEIPRSGSPAYWAEPVDALALALGSGPAGLPAAEAESRARANARRRPLRRLQDTRLAVLLAQIRSPLLFILIFAAVISGLTGAWSDAAIVLVIVIATVGVGYSREVRARDAVAALQSRVRITATVVRDGLEATVPSDDVVEGDLVVLTAGSLIPADGVVVEASHFFVNEAALTGESFPAEKGPGLVDRDTALRDRTNCVFRGSSVRSGTARCLMVRTGERTELGAIAVKLGERPPEAEFDRGVRKFGYLLTIAMLVLVLLVFAAHMLRGRPVVETLLFSVALAVGLSPELLPAILSVNLARGAQMMARRGVIVRRLNAIENLGSLDILCTDKTGTLTEGVVELEGAYDAAGRRSDEVLRLGAVNAALETGVGTPLDDAILRALRPDPSNVRKLAEIPFDFIRKRVTVVMADASGPQLIMKGAFEPVLDVCILNDEERAAARLLYDAWTGQGIRVLAVAVRPVPVQPAYDRETERDLTFAGFLTFFDRPKADAGAAIAALGRLGVSLKVITGDSARVAQHVAASVGMRSACVITGRDLLHMSDDALLHSAERTDLFVEVDPNQKERIILALKKRGHVVGFLGDGINDAPAMHAADTSLAVESAVDVAREAADFVLMEKSLNVIRDGVEEGRRTFANTSKYILTTTSANLGNMLSMAAASLVLPFLPLLANQILLNNFLSDIPAVGLADDSVDPEMTARPERWNMRAIGAFMVVFGVVSSMFDVLTFAVLLIVFRAGPPEFRTGWFVESLLTELAIALVVRTRRPFWRSRPGTLLLWSTLALIALTLALPYVPAARLFGFVPLPPALLAAVCGITALYVAATEAVKRRFYRTPSPGVDAANPA